MEHECNTQRSVGYYLEALLMLAPFMKKPLKAVLKGVTNDPTDPSVSNVYFDRSPDGPQSRIMRASFLPHCSSGGFTEGHFCSSDEEVWH